MLGLLLNPEPFASLGRLLQETVERIKLRENPTRAGAD
jgi:hypothetical protein